MLNSLFDLGRQALLQLDPERAHELTIAALERGVHPRDTGFDAPALAASLGPLRLTNPIGIAAGFDKDACRTRFLVSAAALPRSAR